MPCQPPAHVHVYWFCRLLHVAPFWHGLLAHSSISVKEIVFNIRTITQYQFNHCVTTMRVYMFKHVSFGRQFSVVYRQTMMIRRRSRTMFTLITVCTLPSSCTRTRITIDFVCTSTSIDTWITSTLVYICNVRITWILVNSVLPVTHEKWGISLKQISKISH